MKIALLYAMLATIATVANIGTQDVLLRAYSGPHHVLASVACGTVAGLVVKYVLDKRYIFRFQARDAVQDGQIFVLYAAMGLLTTLVFLCFEFGFHALFDASREMRYLGGGIGLIVGYTAKYQLDKRYVFRVAG